MSRRIALLLLCGSASVAMARDVERTLNGGGATRSFRVHIPDSLGADHQAPLVLVLHGGGGNNVEIATNSRFSEKADEKKFIVAYPNGVGRRAPAFTWNASHCCAFAMTSHSPDVEFISKVIDDIEKLHPVDAKRVYITGMSNGGMMSYRVAGALANRIAAAGIVSGAMFDDQPKPSQPVSMIIFHGQMDPIVPFAGGTSTNALVAQSMDAPFLGVQFAFDYWAKQDGCVRADSGSAGPGVIRETRETCQSGTAVVLYEIHDGVHAWPGGTRAPAVDQSINATNLMWAFFESHPKL